MRRTALMRWFGCLLGAALLGGFAAGVAPPTVDAQGSQFTLFDQAMVHKATTYAQATSTFGPTDWTSPVDYRNGHVYLRFDVTVKPTTFPMSAQLCLWRNSFAQEICSPQRSFTTTGVHWFDLGVPNTWYKKGGVWDFTLPFSPARLMIKDPSRGELMMTGSCGAKCYTGPETVSDHVPISIQASIVVVPAGGSLVAPANWAGCPVTWSASCAPTDPPPDRGVAKLIASRVTVVAADRPLVAWLTDLGFSVQVVDDDGLTASKLEGADLVVISSSVSPTKIGSWISTLPTPILSSEVKLAPKLGIGTGGTELTGQKRIRIVDPSSPLAAGTTGSVMVATTGTTIGGVRGWPGGVHVVATTDTATSNIATIVSAEAGAALRSGPAAARRVGLFFGAPTPLKTNANGRMLFDAAASWLADTAPPPWSAAWWDSTYTGRVPVELAPSGVQRTDALVTTTLDLSSAAPSAGAAIDVAALRVVEIDQAGAVVDEHVPFQFDQGAGFDPLTAVRGEIVILAPGITAAGTARRFHVYAAPVTSGLPPTAVADRVIVSSATDEGQAGHRIDLAGSSWWYQGKGAGFSSIVDSDGNDWISYSTAAGSKGVYRGIPNAAFPQGHFHPGSQTGITTLRSDGPLRAILESVTTDGKWQAEWEIYPTFARLTMLRADDDYWFLYEGTPGGAVDGNDTVLRSSGAVAGISTSWVGDLPEPEWAAFRDSGVRRSLFVSHPTSDSVVDSYRLMNGEMTVFGFGRDLTTSDFLVGRHQLVVGLVDSIDAGAVAAAVADATTAPGRGGPVEHRP